MTVSELIAKLQTTPPNAIVIYRACSDWWVLDEDDVEFVSAGESKRLVDDVAASGHPCCVVDGAICYRGGRYCNAYPLAQYPPDEQPVYHDVVTLPGN